MPDNLTQTIDEFQGSLLGLTNTSQLIILVVALAATWILQFLARRLLKAMEINLPDVAWSHTLMVVLRRIAFPLTFLILINLSMEILRRLGRDVDFLELIGRVIVIWLIYRVLTALVDTNLTSEKAHFWSRKVLLPLALIIGVLSALGLLQNILNWGIYIESIGWRLTIREVEEVLIEVAHQHPKILADPAPTVQFREFGDSSLNFELLVWTLKAIETPVLTSDLRFSIWDALAARNIEIPFPQRDIHIRSGVPWSDLTQAKGEQ